MIASLLLPLCCLAAQPDNGASFVQSLAFSPGGKLLAVGGSDGDVRLYDAPKTEESHRLQGAGRAIVSVAFSPDGSWLVAGDDAGQLHCWDLAAKKLRKSWQAHSRSVAALAFVPDTQRLASGSHDSSIAFWTLPDGKLDQRWKLGTGRITSLAFAGDGKTLAAAGAVDVRLEINTNLIGTSQADQVRLWTVAGGKARTLDVRGVSVALSRDGRFLAAGGLVTDVRQSKRGTSIDGLHRIRVVDLAGKNPPRDIPWKGELVAISHNGQWLATGGGHSGPYSGGIIAHNSVNGRRYDARICLWNLADGKRLLRCPQEDATALAFSPDDAYLATVDRGGTVKFWDLAREKKQPTPDPTDRFSATKEPFLLELERDYEELLKQEPRAELVREAKDLIYRGNFADGVALLRKERPIAAIPLLLRAWVDWQGKGTNTLDSSANLARSWMILTGKVLGPSEPPPKAVEAVVASWWRPNKAKISLDLASYSPEQLQVIAGLLFADEPRQTGGGVFMSDAPTADGAEALAERIGDLIHPDPDERTWWEEDLHPKMLPLILRGLERAAAPFAPIEWQYLPALTALARGGQEKALRQAIEDPHSPARVHIPCLWAVTLASGKLPAASALALLQEEKRLEHRLALLLLLEHGSAQDVSEALLRALADPHRQVRKAAMLALPGPKPPEAVPVLRKLLLDSRSDVWPQTVADTLVRYRTREAQQALIAYLEKTLANPHSRQTYRAVKALEGATGQRFLGPKDVTEEDHREAARRVLKWWRAQDPQ
jgi:WD40 repeat protein